ncbi:MULTISPECIES: hypothetical protein [unclassified Streptomyces]|uniref:hypothetical protein n=1 Tax=unclassified Streptomyces TaxID=2593676 RepID=UPI0004BDB1E4|nr:MULTISPECIES: hypothetical protein [unclassified Streptomyces]
MSDTSPAAAPWEAPLPAQEQRLVDTVAAHPTLDNVGALADLLAQLPPQMSPWLDEHHREDREHRLQQQFLAVTPRIVGVSNTEGPGMEAGLELGMVHIPFNTSPDERAALAVRRDLLPSDIYARAEKRMENGQVPAGLGSLASLLREIAGHVVAATEWMDRDHPDAEALHAEADQINQAGIRLGELAKTIKQEDCG